MTSHKTHLALLVAALVLGLSDSRLGVDAAAQESNAMAGRPDRIASSPQNARRRTQFPDRETSGMLSRAIALTAKGAYPEAREIYERLAQENPAEGVPALGRFLRLANQKEALQSFVAKLESQDCASRMDLHTRARGLASAGAVDEATSILLDSASVRSGELPEATVFLARLLRDQGRDLDREDILSHAVVHAPAREWRARFFRSLLGSENSRLEDSPTSFLIVLERGMEAMGADRQEAVRLVDPVILRWHQSPKYFTRREAILAGSKELGPGAGWFATRMLVREEQVAEALNYLRPLEQKYRLSPMWPLLAEEEAELERALGRTEEARGILETLARQRTGQAGAGIALEAAQAELAAGSTSSTLALLSNIEIQNLAAEDHLAYWVLYLKAAAKPSDVSRVIEIYGRATVETVPDEMDLFHKTIFEVMTVTEQRLQLEETIRQEFKNNSKTPSNLWRLAAAAASVAGRKPDELEALYQCALARPGDLGALSALADAVAPVAVELSKAPSEGLAVPQSEVAKLADLAEQSLKALIRAQPYAPDRYAALINYYKSRGKDEAASHVPRIVTQGSTDAHLLGVAGYALATNGYPIQAMEYYDRALKIAPDDMDILMNRTACLTRVGRTDEADAIYREVLEKGFRGHKYHAHELVGRIWGIAEHRKTEDECIDYFRKVSQRLNGTWKEETLQTAAGILARKGRMPAAREFYVILQQEGSSADIRIQAWEDLAMAYADQKRYEETEKIFREAAERFSDRPEVVIDMTQGRAEALGRQGRTDEAINVLCDLAHRNPSSLRAQDGLYRAAALAEEAGNTNLARRLYREFLASPSTDFVHRKQAEEKAMGLP